LVLHAYTKHHLEIRTKWMIMNKLDESGVVVRNKDELVAKGYNQEEAIYFDETLPLWLDYKLSAYYSHLHLIWV